MSESELERLRDKQEKLEMAFHAAVLQIHVDIATLKVKAGIWGALGGAIPVLVFFLMKMMERK